MIELSRKTLVVLDKERAAPFDRLWCLYEMGATPAHKLQLLTHGFGANMVMGVYVSSPPPAKNHAESRMESRPCRSWRACK